MPSICLYFQVHQPYRLRHYSAFDAGKSHDYFDERLNREVMQRVARKCYLPANQLLAQLFERHEGQFRVAFSLTGVAVEQMREYAPEALESFQRLVATGGVELLGETYYHSLSSLQDPSEFREQVALHKRAMESTFGLTPKVFRNTELIYDDALARAVAALGFDGVLAEGADDVLNGESPNRVYRAGDADLALLLRNYRFSDDIAFRFSNQNWSGYPLTADKFARALSESLLSAETANLFMDYETFGEHQWADTGILRFLEELPTAVLSRPGWSFRTPSELIAICPKTRPLSVSRITSWADEARDVTAWRGNEMQTRALERVYALGERVKRRGTPALLAAWRKLTTSDHFYYMCTKWFEDGNVHAYFSPFESPYEAFISFMNALGDLEDSLLRMERITSVHAPAP